jgi:hypothetical protein
MIEMGALLCARLCLTSMCAADWAKRDAERWTSWDSSASGLSGHQLKHEASKDEVWMCERQGAKTATQLSGRVVNL